MLKADHMVMSIKIRIEDPPNATTNYLVYECEEYCGETNLFIVIVIAF